MHFTLSPLLEYGDGGRGWGDRITPNINMAETQVESQVNCKTIYDQVKFVDKGYLF